MNLIQEWFLHWILITFPLLLHLIFQLWDKIKSRLTNASLLLVSFPNVCVQFDFHSFPIYRILFFSFPQASSWARVLWPWFPWGYTAGHRAGGAGIWGKNTISVLSRPLNEALLLGRSALLLHKQTWGRLGVSAPMALLATPSPDILHLLMEQSPYAETPRCMPDRNRVAGLFQQMHNGDIITY